MAPPPTSLKPLEAVVTPAQMAVVESLNLKVMAVLAGETPDTPLPWGQRALPDIRMMDGTHRFASRVAFYDHEQKTVFLSAAYVATLKPLELAAVVAHEYGHHFLPHAQKLANKHEKDGLSPVFMRFNRELECEADHFAQYFVPNAGVHLAMALGKMRDGYVYDNKDPEQTHPSDVSRAYNISRDQEWLKERLPGTVRFTGQCAPKAELPSPSATPPVPDLSPHSPKF